MDVEHLDTMHSVPALPRDPDDHGHTGYFLCEIVSWVPLLRAVARLRTRDEAEAGYLVKATLQCALADPAQRLPTNDLRPWLLGLQRAIHATMGQAVRCDEPAVDESPARGVNATWQRLHLALQRLPERQREALVLADGAYCRADEMAPILGCSPASARRLVRHARAGLLARLAAPQPLPVPPQRPPSPRRPVAGLALWPRRACRHATSKIHPKRPRRPQRAAGDNDARHSFACRLNSALFRALWRDATVAAARHDLEDLIADAASVRSGRPQSTPSRARSIARRTSWLRLMFIAYALPNPFWAEQRK